MAARGGGIAVSRKRRTSQVGTLLRTRAFRRGFVGGSRFWLALGIVAWVLGRLAGSEQRATLELRPGERVLITHEKRPATKT